MTTAEDKSALRRIIKGRIAGLEDEYIIKSDEAIYKRLSSLEEFSRAPAVLCYFSVGREVSTAAVIDTALKNGKAVALPVSYPQGRMVFRLVNDLNGLAISKFGIPEPEDNCQEIVPSENSIVIVPGLCFDKNRFRLGHGGGYYDRFLENFRGISVGLCRQRLLQDRISAESHDVQVDIIVTEDGILRK